jgi:hypothetical protein
MEEILLKTKMVNEFIISQYASKVVIHVINQRNQIEFGWSVRLDNKKETTRGWTITDVTLLTDRGKLYIAAFRWLPNNQPKAAIYVAKLLTPPLMESKAYKIALKPIGFRYIIDNAECYTIKNLNICLFPSEVCLIAVNYEIIEPKNAIVYYYRMEFCADTLPTALLVGGFAREILELCAKPSKNLEEERFLEFGKSYKGSYLPKRKVIWNGRPAYLDNPPYPSYPDIDTYGFDVKEIKKTTLYHPEKLGPFYIHNPYMYSCVPKLFRSFLYEYSLSHEKSWIYYISRRNSNETGDGYNVHLIDSERTQSILQNNLYDKRVINIGQMENLLCIGKCRRKLWAIQLDSQSRAMKLKPLCFEETLSPLRAL